MGKIFKTAGKAKPVIAIVGVASLKDNRLIYILMSALIKSGCKSRTKWVVIARLDDKIERRADLSPSERAPDRIYVGESWLPD
jgi:hypothetical protein